MPDSKMPRIENPKLREAMRKLREADTENRMVTEEEFVRELLSAQFLMPAEFETPMPLPKPGEGPIQVQGKLKMFVLNAQNQESYLMAFTDAEEMRKWQKEGKQHVLLWRFPQYANILLKPDCPHIGFVINPYGENVIVKKDFIERIMKRLKLVTPTQKPFVLGGEPERAAVKTDYSDYPDGLAEAVIEYVKNSGDVELAYLMNVTKGEEKELLMVVKTTENPRYLFPCIQNAAEPKLAGYTLNILSLDTDVAKAAVQGQQPIFAR